MLRTLPLCLLLLLPAPSAFGQTAKLTGRIEFRCLWWSAEQQRNFNPNQPPPKTTEVTIDRWEYSDPVGVPHPDSISVHVFVRNDTHTATAPIRVRSEVRWKTGRQSDAKSAQWEPRPVFLASLDAAPIAAGEQVGMHAPIAIQARIAALEKRDWWPHELEVTVTVTDSRTGRLLLREQRPFRIQPGD